MIDVRTEELISLSEAGRRLKINGQAVSPVTVYRWATQGRGPCKVRLETLRVGAKVCTSAEALQRFLDALNPAPIVPPKRTPAERRKSHARAEKELAAMGV